MIGLKNKYIDEISMKPILVGSSEFEQMAKSYTKLIEYLCGKNDDYIEDFKEVLKTKNNK